MNNPKDVDAKKKTKFPFSMRNENKTTVENSKPVQAPKKTDPIQAPAKKEKKLKAEPLKKQNPNAGALKKNFFGKEKKKSRAEYQAEIDELKKELAKTRSSLSVTESQLNETNQKYGTLCKWAESAPIPPNSEL
jgi:ribosomal protein L29